jgi:hypothetical protein
LKIKNNRSPEVADFKGIDLLLYRLNLLHVFKSYWRLLNTETKTDTMNSILKPLMIFTLAFCVLKVNGQVKSHYNYLDTLVSGRTKHYVFTKKKPSDKSGTVEQFIFCDQCPDEGLLATGTFRESGNSVFITFIKPQEPGLYGIIEVGTNDLTTFTWYEETGQVNSFSLKIGKDTTTYYSDAASGELYVPKNKLSAETPGVSNGTEFVYSDTIRIFRNNTFIFSTVLFQEKTSSISDISIARMWYSEPNKTYKLDRKKFKLLRYDKSTNHYE